MTAAPEFPELGFYGLAGHSDNPGDLIDEVRRAEEIGLGAVFLSERFNYKDAAVMAGMAAAASTRIGIATAATNHNTRHPLVTMTMGSTLHRATGGRFCLGLGRGFAPLFDMMGVPRITNAQLTDAFDVLRRLWAGEQFGHDGPIGSYPFLFPLSPLDERIPLLMVSIGPKSMALAGRIADAVVLHTFMTDEAVARSVAAVRRSAEAAGRDPASVRIWACTAVIDENAMDEQTRLRKTVGRLATYLQGYGETLVDANGWDPALLRKFKADPFVTGFSGAFDAVGTTDDLQHLADHVIPAEWLAAHITGDARSCAVQVRDQFGATGVDSIILHGVNPDQLADVTAAYREVRSPDVPALPANPGWMR
ncbi:TIGR03857 family LLM class F420-dependent oxidoreductase [Marmoricola sp. RAF53]|uniref:TIGR03857 family LLM class F420-dependent oxidoreductase n=1 Tax=Marmoricola sp. RAF53 TaxID=3233059 RepID=UPI003F975642